MILQRYIRRDREQGTPFGEFMVIEQKGLTWYMREDQIGIKMKDVEGVKEFLGGFLSEEDKLIIAPYNGGHEIFRESHPKGRMTGKYSGVEEVNHLIRLLQSQDELHAYLSSENENGRPAEILTFSTQEPVNSFYYLGAPMEIVVKTKPIVK